MATNLLSSSPPTSPRHTANFSKMGSWDAEEDSQNLFQKHSVAEIMELEKRARGDIERKKEELRLMVGERYRDLIDAADTIGEMKQCSNTVNHSIKTIQGNCKHLYQTHQSRGVSGQIATPSVNQSKTRFYSVASQMKLLVDTPEKVWNALEHHEYLKAAQLYLLAQNIVSSLHIDTGSNAPSKLLTSFPILPRQWSSISHFKDSILQGSRKLLRDHTQSEQTVAECLCAIMFLEDSSPRQVFNEFLLARQASLQELFHPSQQATGIKIQLCEVVRLIMSSVYQVYVLFSSEEVKETTQSESAKTSLLFEMVNKITSRNESSTSEGELLKQLFGQEFDLALLRHLPASVVGFRPRVRSVSTFITAEYIQNNCKTWFQKCVEDVKKSIGGFLQYVGTLKGLASIRDAIWELLNPTVESTASSYQNAVLKQWDTVTTKCLGNILSLWDELFKDEFVSRSKTILHGQLEALTTSCKTSTTKALEDLSTKPGSKPDRGVLWERDLSLYVWHESSSDLPAKTGRQPESETAGSEVAAGVSMINASLESGTEQSTIEALENADVGLRGVTRECQAAYHTRLKETKGKKGQQAGPWLEQKIPQGFLFYYNTATQQTSWAKPADFTNNSGLLTKEEIQTVVSNETAKHGRHVYLQANEPSIVRLQAHWRGYLARKTFNERKQFMTKQLPAIIKIQANLKRWIQHKKYNDRLEVLHNNDDAIIKIQAWTRMHLARSNYKQRKQLYEDNLPAIVKIQAFMRANLAQHDYRAL
ncbi:Conserved oligomeric Golgi complex subunit 1, partial [Paramuricea clavata]